MSNSNKAEVWLRGPIEGIVPLLQPVAHALLQAKEEVTILFSDFNDNKLWIKPFGLASTGFHLQHLTGVVDRLFTYGEGRQLSLNQITALQSEGVDDPTLSSKELVAAFYRQVDLAIEQLKHTIENDLTASREVGRAKVSSTVIGLYVHAAEHTMRHIGQLLVTVRCVNGM